MRLIAIIVLYSNTTGLGMVPFNAKAISFIQAFFVILILLLINIINSLKCYIIKSKVIDPPMPWGDDDLLGTNIIPLAYSIFTTVFISVMYALGLHPEMYYALMEHHRTELYWSQTNHILPGLVVILGITGIITGIVAKVYDAANKQLLEASIAHQINYSLGIFPPILLVLITSLLYLLNFYEVLTLINFLQTIHIVVSLLYIIVPALVLYRVPQGHSHAAKFFKNKREDAFLLNIYLTPVLITVLMYPSLFFLYQLLDI
jgi:hypothetical protein